MFPTMSMWTSTKRTSSAMILASAFWLTTACSQVVLPETTSNFEATAPLKKNRIDAKILHEEQVQPDFVYVDTTISEQQMQEISSFDVLWPSFLPSGYELKHFAGFTLNGTNTVVDDFFALHYGIDEERWLILQQDTSTQISLSQFTQIGTSTIGGETVPVYKQTSGVTGNFTVYHFQYKNILLTLKAIELSQEEILKIVSSLSPK